jgi:hypothetical protein
LVVVNNGGQEVVLRREEIGVKGLLHPERCRRKLVNLKLAQPGRKGGIAYLNWCL